jgi:hypothetical protein
MKRKATSLLFALGLASLLAACGEPTTPVAPDPEPEPVQPADPYAKYQGRISRLEFTNYSFLDAPYHSNDPAYFDDSKELSTYATNDKIDFYYLGNAKEALYLPLESLAKLFTYDLAPGVKSSVSDKDGKATWRLEKSATQYYSLSVDDNAKTISYSGDGENFLKDHSREKKALLTQAKITTSYEKGREAKEHVFSYANYGFDAFKVDGKICMPFSLLLPELQKFLSRSFVTVGAKAQIFTYFEGMQLDTQIKVDGKEPQLKDYIRTSLLAAYPDPDPKYSEARAYLQKEVVELNKKVFYYVMDNSYGLGKEKHILSMSDYFETFAEAKNLTSMDPTKRTSAYTKLVRMLNDLHSGYTPSSFYSEGVDDTSLYGQTFFENRMAVHSLLSTQRTVELARYAKENGIEEELSPEDVRYSKDGKTAYFSFDSFQTYSYFGDVVPESEKKNDSFLRFVMKFSEIKKHPTVENVVIDDSLNGGGYVAMMGKLLALISKDNKSVMTMWDDGDDSILHFTTQVDSNNDGKYDLEDCFGDDYDISIVTSQYSFSCGNAFPFYAAVSRIARIIGQKSGGGECAVFGYSLPTGQSLGYSSPFHLGYYDPETKTFTGDEGGAGPNIPISNTMSNLYDVDAVGKMIEIRKNPPKA